MVHAAAAGTAGDNDDVMLC